LTGGSRSEVPSALSAATQGTR